MQHLLGRCGLEIESESLNVYAILGIFLGTLALLNYLFPLNDMPFPGGPHSVGFRSFEVTNPEPIGVSGVNYSDSAKIRLGIWYPADEVSVMKERVG